MTTPSDPAPSPTWGPETRSVASLLLFAHLFALVVAVTTYTSPSALQLRLHDLFDPYLRTLRLTAFPASYPFARYHLTHALQTDADFTCQVEFRDAQGAARTESIPSGDLQPLVRYRRYQSLANATGTLADAEAETDFGGILPKAIAGSILKRHGAKQGVFRCRAYDPPAIEEVINVESARSPSRQAGRDVYEAQVFVSATGTDLLRKSATLEVAPTDTRQRRPGATKRPSPPERQGGPQP